VTGREVGTLRYVSASHGTGKHCHWVIAHANDYYIGALMFDDAKFCWMVSTALQYHHIGRSIKAIGDLDFFVQSMFPQLVAFTNNKSERALAIFSSSKTAQLRRDLP
jgi:hypothetical protein